MVLGISEFDVEDTLDSMLNDIESPKIKDNGQSVEQDVHTTNTSKDLFLSRIQLIFGRLSDEQIKIINETGEIPSNAKFVRTIRGYKIANNWCNFRTGTSILPFGYEVKKNIFGFAIVVPVGTRGFFIKK